MLFHPPENVPSSLHPAHSQHTAWWPTLSERRAACDTVTCVALCGAPRQELSSRSLSASVSVSLWPRLPGTWRRPAAAPAPSRSGFLGCSPISPSNRHNSCPVDSPLAPLQKLPRLWCLGLSGKVCLGPLYEVRCSEAGSVSPALVPGSWGPAWPGTCSPQASHHCPLAARITALPQTPHPLWWAHPRTTSGSRTLWLSRVTGRS